MVLIDLCAGSVVGYCWSSLVESYFHRVILHAPRIRRLYWKKYNAIFGVFRVAYFSHNVIHHQKTFNYSYTKQFSRPHAKQSIDSKVEKIFGDAISRTHYGLTINTPKEIFAFMFPLVLLALVVGYYAQIWIAIGMILVSLLYPAMSMFLHPVLHLSDAAKSVRYGKLMLRLLNTKYVQHITVYHYLHHKTPRWNYNLLLGGDWVFGCYRAPTKNDLNNLANDGIGLSIKAD